MRLAYAVRCTARLIVANSEVTGRHRAGSQHHAVLVENLGEPDAEHLPFALVQVRRVLQTGLGLLELCAHALEHGRAVESERGVRAHVVEQGGERIAVAQRGRDRCGAASASARSRAASATSPSPTAR